MSNAEFFRAKALQCRELLRETTDRDLAAQLRLWIDDFEQAALSVEQPERSAASVRRS